MLICYFSIVENERLLSHNIVICKDLTRKYYIQLCNVDPALCYVFQIMNGMNEDYVSLLFGMSTAIMTFLITVD